MQRRKLDLPDADAVIAEVSRLRDQGYQPTGKWNLSQICEHLAGTSRFGLDPTNRKVPWIIRKLVTNFLFRRLLKTRSMPKGVPAPRGFVPKLTSSSDDPAKIEDYINLVNEIRDLEGPFPSFPMADNVRYEDWKQFQWIHAAHHLSFLVPNQEREAVQA